jgi:phage N-6-adenine-methyltransferase
MSKQPLATPSNHLTREIRTDPVHETASDRNDRPRPVVPLSHNASTLDQLTVDARAAEQRITDLEQAHRRTAKIVLLENLDQAERIATAVRDHGQPVAAFARAAWIEERRAQRIFKLAAKADEIRKFIRDGETKHGDDFECPSWKHFVPTQQKADSLTHETPRQPSPSLILDEVPPGMSTEQAVEHHQSALVRLGRDIVGEFNKGKKADKGLLANLEHRQSQHRQQIIELQESPPASAHSSAETFVRAQDEAELTRLQTVMQQSASRIAELEAEVIVARRKIDTLASKKTKPYGLFAKGDPERETPQHIFEHYDRQFHFTIDVAASAKNKKCKTFFTKIADGLKQPWHGNVWLNPPFNNMEPWCEKAWKYAASGMGTVVALLPVWTGTAWYQKYAIHGHIRQLTSRISFVGTPGSAPFDCMIVVWTKDSQYENGRLHVTLDDLPPDPTKIAKEKPRAIARRRIRVKP